MVKQYKIAICDNEAIWVIKIKEIIEKYFLYSRNDVQISTFGNAELLLNSNLDFDYLFLDVEMPELSGIEVKKQLWKKSKTIGIIFITNYDQYMSVAFGKNVIDYIGKENLDSISDVLKQIECENSEFEVIEVSGEHIRVKDIMYLKGDGSYTDVVLNNKEIIKSAMTIHKLQEKLNNKLFVRAHKSHVINLSYITNYNYEFVLLHKEVNIAVSRTYRKSLEVAYFKYLRDE